MQVELSEETARLVDSLAQAGYGSAEEVVARAVDLLNEADRRYVERMVEEGREQQGDRPGTAHEEVMQKARALVDAAALRAPGVA